MHQPGLKQIQQDFQGYLIETGSPHEIITPFSKNNLEADRKAFVRLMQYIKETDSKRTNCHYGTSRE
jgi:hypothetical protein